MMYLVVKNARFLLCAGAVVAAMASCKPTTIEPDQPVEATTGFQQVRPADSFTWSTSRNVTFVVTGLNVGANIVKPLQIQALSGEVFYTRMHNLDQNLSIGITLPGHLDKVRVVYGDISKELSITNGKLEFDFIQPTAPIEGE
jgi:hypothetical protein